MAKTYYVSSQGSNNNLGTKDNPWKTIDFAVSEDSPVKAGDTILVKSGVYTEIITLGKSGDDKLGHITLKADGNVTLRDPRPTQGGFREGVIQSAGKGYWIIDGFRIENTSWAGISLRDANNMVVQNNHTYETGASGIIVMPDSYYSGGEAEVTNSNIKVLNNTIERANWKWRTTNDPGAPQEALSIWGVDGFEIAGNILTQGKKEGIDVKVGSRNGSIHDNEVTGVAMVSGTHQGYRGGPAIYLDGNRAAMSNIDVYNNIVYGNTAGGIVISDEIPDIGDVSDIRVYNNVVFNNGIQGVNGGEGIGIRSNVRDVEVVNNTFAKNVQAFSIDGLNSSGGAKSSDILVRNNIFADSSYRHGVIADVDNLRLDHNLFTDGFNQLYSNEGGLGNLITGNNIKTPSVGFVNVAENNFHLTAASAAIDMASQQVGGYALFDPNGVRRNQGIGPDIGAYEYSGSASNRTDAKSSRPSRRVDAAGGETIKGSNDNDIIKPKGGNDKVLGGRGNDTIYWSAGDDNLYGGRGSDVLHGGNGKDRLFGEAGNDMLRGGKHDDVLKGGGGEDKIIGVNTTNAQPGKHETDMLFGGGGGDIFYLGDNSKVYYDDHLHNTFGLADYALIKDFKPSQGDTIQLHGQSSDYWLGSFLKGGNGGTAIFWKTLGKDELIAVVQTRKKLSIKSDAFSFV